MYRCYNLKSEISRRRSQFLFRCYLTYVFVALILLFFVTITYDWRTGNSRFTLLPNGHCNFIDQYSYNTLFLSDTFIAINKLVQIMMFVSYLVYFYKFCVNIGDTQILNVRYNRELLKIAIAMGATIGLSFFIWMFLIFYPDYSYIISISGTVLLLIQQVMIMSIFLCTKRCMVSTKHTFQDTKSLILKTAL